MKEPSVFAIITYKSRDKDIVLWSYDIAPNVSFQSMAVTDI